MSGIEFARMIIKKAYKDKKIPPAQNSEEASPEYWAGWALAEYQWISGHLFKDIFERIPLSKIISMYSVYHEMDETPFIDKTQAHTLYKISRVLGCNIEDILENPMK